MCQTSAAIWLTINKKIIDIDNNGSVALLVPNERHGMVQPRIDFERVRGNGPKPPCKTTTTTTMMMMTMVVAAAAAAAVVGISGAARLEYMLCDDH